MSFENPKTDEASQKTPDELDVLWKRITDLIPQLYLGDFVKHDDYVQYLNLSEKEMNKLKKNNNKQYPDNQSLLVSYSAHNLIVDPNSPNKLPIIEEFKVVFNLAKHDRLNYGCWRGTKIDYDGNAPGLLHCNIFYHSCFLTRTPKNVEVFNCNGDKCRLNLSNGDVFCKSCYVICAESVLRPILKQTIETDSIPKDAIVYIKRELKQFKTKLDYYYALVDVIHKVSCRYKELWFDNRNIESTIAKLEKKISLNNLLRRNMENANIDETSLSVLALKTESEIKKIRDCDNHELMKKDLELQQQEEALERQLKQLKSDRSKLFYSK